MIDTNITFERLQAWEEACNEVRHLLRDATDAERPGLEKALERLDEIRIGVSNFHSQMCQAAEKQARALGEVF